MLLFNTERPLETHDAVTQQPQPMRPPANAVGVTVEVLKVSSKSNPNSVAGALAGIVREQGAVEIQTVGAGALNQAVKAIAIARGFIAPSGMELTCVPAFADILINGEERTAIRLLVEPRDMHH
jgi:stage V sporulation protein S